MRYLPVVLMFGVVLSGCSTLQSVRQKLPAAFGGTSVADPRVQHRPELPTIDISEPEAFMTRFKPSSMSLGSWVDPVFGRKDGSLFELVPRMHASNAIVYLYRPASRWNAQEIIAPNFYLNGEKIPSLRNSHYYWLELPAGDYRLTVRRPLAVINFQKGTVVDFNLAAGQTYFLRYDEQNFRGKPDPALGLLQKGPISQMPTRQGLAEIRKTTLNTSGYAFVDNPDVARQTQLPTANEQLPNPVQRERLTERDPVELGVPFKIWNPLTW
ncbi:MAG: DUF2846 domain-containing protein [Pseudomonadota bacterium]|nr:DUF2846 domain-containing protein [Pseudomonadota bacterium]